MYRSKVNISSLKASYFTPKQNVFTDTVEIEVLTEPITFVNNDG